MIDEATTDLNEAKALSNARDIIDIYSNGWGPSDTGSEVTGPRTVTKLAMKNGVEKVYNSFFTHLCSQILFLRDVKERGPYLCGLMATEVSMMTVQQMAMHPAYTPSLLGLLEWMAGQVHLMSSALQNLSQHM